MTMRCGTAVAAALAVFLAPGAFGAEPPRTKDLSADQQQALEKLRKEMWDEGYSDQEIKDALEARRREILGAPQAAPPPRDDREARVTRVVHDLVAKGVIPKTEAERIRGELMACDPAGAWNRVREMWKDKLVGDRQADGMEPDEARQDVARWWMRKREEILTAWRYLHEQGIEGEKGLAKLGSRFPGIPEIALAFLEEESSKASPRGPGPGMPPPPPPPGDGEDEFSDDEIDEIAEALIQELGEEP